MPITKETILAVAKASCIDLSEKELGQYVVEFNSILEAFSKMKEVNTKEVQPAFHPIPLADVAREDVSQQGCSQEQALGLSTHTSKGYFVGPKIL